MVSQLYTKFHNTANLIDESSDQAHNNNAALWPSVTRTYLDHQNTGEPEEPICREGMPTSEESLNEEDTLASRKNLYKEDTCCWTTSLQKIHTYTINMLSCENDTPVTGKRLYKKDLLASGEHSCKTRCACSGGTSSQRGHA